MKKTDTHGRKLKVNDMFDAFAASFLSDPDTKKSYIELKERGDSFFIAMSHELVKEGTFDILHSTEPQTVKERFRRSIIGLILSFEESLRASSKQRKIALVDALCRVFQVSTYEEKPASSSSLFSDLGSKVVAYVAGFATEISGLLTIFNLIVGGCRFVNDTDFKISRHNVGMMCYTVLATIVFNGRSGYDQGTKKNFIKLVCQGLCISLAHYAASYPFMTEKIFRCKLDSRTAGAHYLLNGKEESPPYGSESNAYHAVNFLLSVIWPLVTYLAYFGGGSYVKPALMAAYLANTSGAFMGHKIPRGAHGALSLLTLSSPDNINWGTSIIMGTTKPSDKGKLRKVRHDIDWLEYKAKAPKTSWAGYTDMVNIVRDDPPVKYDVAENYALLFLDIMKTYLILWREPIVSDAFDVFKSTGLIGGDMMWDVATMFNSLSPAPCTFAAMGGYSYDEMLNNAKKIMNVHFVNEGETASDKTNGVISVAKLLKPTIQGFLYAYQTRSFTPRTAGIECLGLEQSNYKVDMKTPETTAFLNMMDSYFFTYLKNELGITAENEHQFRGVNRFFVYS